MDGIGNNSLWKTTIKNYSYEKRSEQQVSLNSLLSKLPEEHLELSQQCLLLSAFPNYHHWASKKNHGVKRDEYFITKGKSPRNKLMTLALLAKNFLGDPEEYYYINSKIKAVIQLVVEKRYHVDSLPEIRRRTVKPRNNTKKIDFGHNDLLEYIGLSEEEYEEQKKQSVISLSTYEAYKKFLFESGTILWRVKQPSKHVVVMNDYHSEQGDFKVNRNYVCFTIEALL